MQVINSIPLNLLFSIIPFSFTLLIDLCLGKPAAEEFDRKAIFFAFSLFLAKRRLKQAGKLKDLESTYLPNMNSKDLTIRQVAKMEFRQVTFQDGREFFSWELGAGMCPYCTNIRISIIAAVLYFLFFGGGWLSFLLVPCFSNMYLLFFNKFKN